MKAAGVSNIKDELSKLPPKKLLEICLRLARYKKDNKELLSFLLFDAHNEHGFVENVKHEIEEQFLELPKGNWYLNKKALRKILRSLSKYCKYVSLKESEVEMLIFFCEKFKATIPFKNNKVLTNLYLQQLKKIEGLIKSLHEDLHHDYNRQLQQLF